MARGLSPGHTLNIAGKRLGPAELESAVVGHPLVAEAAAVGVPHQVKGEVAWVFCALAPGAEPSTELAAELRTRAASELGKAFARERVLFVSALPKTRSAKIVRRAVRAKALGRDPGDLSSLETRRRSRRSPVRSASSLGVLVLALVTLGATWGQTRPLVRCGLPSRLGPSGKPELGRLVFGFYTLGENTSGHAKSVFDPGYPTKVVLSTKQHRPVISPMTLRGWYCADGKRLRFWYRAGQPFAHVPVTQQALESTGDLAPRLANRGYGQFRGYMLFARVGNWKISVWQHRRLLGSVVVQVGG